MFKRLKKKKTEVITGMLKYYRCYFRYDCPTSAKVKFTLWDRHPFGLGKRKCCRFASMQHCSRDMVQRTILLVVNTVLSMSQK
jgi:hypothetical protein